MTLIPKLTASTCRNCRYYQPEGRQGGICLLLHAAVASSWNACQLASPAFAPPWQSLKDLPASGVTQTPAPVEVEVVEVELELEPATQDSLAA